MNKKMKKQYTKIGIIALAVVVLAGGLMLLSQSELFQGRIKQMTLKPYAARDYGVFKNAMNKVVSPVVSAVPTVVTSPVPSQVGPSVVISQVPSAISSPVASGVALTAKDALKYNIKTLPVLTYSVLKTVSNQDKMSNPQKYTLTKDQKRSMINLYMQKMKR